MPSRSSAIGRHHADLGIGRDRGRADRVGVELQELPEPARAGLLVAEHRPDPIGAVGLWQGVEMLGHVAGERRRQVVAQRQPALVIVLEREHALVGPVEVGQEFAERLGIFDEGRLDRLEAIELVGLADRRHDPVGGRKIGRAAVGEAARQPRLQGRRRCLICHALLRSSDGGNCPLLPLREKVPGRGEARKRADEG